LRRFPDSALIATVNKTVSVIQDVSFFERRLFGEGRLEGRFGWGGELWEEGKRRGSIDVQDDCAGLLERNQRERETGREFNLRNAGLFRVIATGIV